MGLFRRAEPDHGKSAATIDWSNIDRIRAEWPQSSLDARADLQGFRQAVALYESNDDYRSMMQCATWFATALAHSLYGPGLLHGTDLPETVHKTIYCALCRPPDGRTFAHEARKAARLALTIARENGWQPASLGGTNPLFDRMVMDVGNYSLLGAAVASPSEVVGDLKKFFSVAPSSPQ